MCERGACFGFGNLWKDMTITCLELELLCIWRSGGAVMEAGCFPGLFWDALGLLVIAYFKVSLKTLLFRDCFGRSHSWSGVTDWRMCGVCGSMKTAEQEKISSRLTSARLYLCKRRGSNLPHLSVSSFGLSSHPLSSLSFHMTLWYLSEAAWQHMDLSDIWCVWQE